MHWTTLLAFIALDTVLCFVPGLAVMSVVGAALTRKAAGFATALGILTGNAIYFATFALGLVSLIVASHAGFLAVKWCGAAYLGYIGIRGLAAKTADESPSETQASRGALRSWAGGTLTQLANPKALVFFAAIVPQFVDPAAQVMLQVVILGIASLAIELVVLSIYVLAVDLIRARGIDPSRQLVARRIGGACLLGVAAAVVVEQA
jgi:homoserine/homoserine lactone efflux protein